MHKPQPIPAINENSLRNSLHFYLTNLLFGSTLTIGKRFSPKIIYRFQVLVPRRQILRKAVMRIIRSAPT